VGVGCFVLAGSSCISRKTPFEHRALAIWGNCLNKVLRAVPVLQLLRPMYVAYFQTFQLVSFRK
jgi:hypothetical protein